MRIDDDQALTDILPGTSVQITRISDRSSDLLRYLESLNLIVGVHVRVDEVSAAADAIRLTVNRASVQLSRLSAAAIRVTAR